MSNEASLKAPPHEAQNAISPLKDFDLRGRVFVVTGGGRGLGLSMAEALMEAGGEGGFLYFQSPSTLYVNRVVQYGV